ncbi:hypothetical protein [Methanocalculus sp.]|uniref:hypothetical protein n=1 Tax=Methanocalculus sp. TaxID=2004547 RepID=UPI00262A467B|nr:hypothetical protein [Methanocalculus sp.]MDG6249751.1 hypothetical protein [Methanocalculus sp.]
MDEWIDGRQVWMKEGGEPGIGASWEVMDRHLNYLTKQSEQYYADRYLHSYQM